MSIETKWDADTEYRHFKDEIARRMNAKWSITNLLSWWIMPIGWLCRGCYDKEAASVCYRIGWKEFTGQHHNERI